MNANGYELNEEEVEDRNRRSNFIKGLRELADWLEARPSVEYDMGFSDSPTLELGFYIPSYSETAKAQFKAAVRNMGGGEKETTSNQFKVVKKFGEGEVAYEVATARDAVCTKRVVARRFVTEEVVDYDKAPTITKERVVEDVEWDCPESILAD